MCSLKFSSVGQRQDRHELLRCVKRLYMDDLTRASTDPAQARRNMTSDTVFAARQPGFLWFALLMAIQMMQDQHGLLSSWYGD
jgi:hypothetical protein